jgi:hypothetical protein
MADYVTLKVTPQARESLRALTFSLTGQVGRRVDLSDALTAACGVAAKNLVTAAATLPTSKETEQ